MEFHGTSKKFHGIPWNFFREKKSSKKFHGIPWNSRVWKKFHGIPWNFGSGHNSMEFHGTARVIEFGALQVPWNSMLLLVSAKLAHSKFHGIALICSCHRNWPNRSSMGFHGTTCVIEIGALHVPWNSMELLVSMEFHGIVFFHIMEAFVSSILWVLNLERIPWNLSSQILMKNYIQFCLMN